MTTNKTAEQVAIEAARIYPKRGQVYTLAEIDKVLYMRDSAHLMFWFEVNGERKELVIQNSCGNVPPVELPGWLDSQWKYMYETDEWIPIFRYAGQQPITDFVTIEDDLCEYAEPGDKYVCIKGLHMDQYMGNAPQAKAPE
jgi:hypothetical protein